MIQLHFLVDEAEWEVAMGPGGALESAIRARDEGLTRFIGVTGHGVTVAHMHLRSLERFDFDAVLLPYSYILMQNPEYAADFNEVKEICSMNSATRTADQTLVARLWAGVGTPTNFLLVWNNVASTVSTARKLTTVEKARLFALTNIALHDALQTAFASKFKYDLWRPVTAIQHADEDDNPNTEPDSGWSSLITTPPYPTYAGNNAAIGTSQSTVLALFFGRDDIRFDHTWEGAGGATRSYAGFTAMADEEARARIYAGIHFTFDNVAGQSVGRNVANYVFLKLMRPRQCAR